VDIGRESKAMLELKKECQGGRGHLDRQRGSGWGGDAVGTVLRSRFLAGNPPSVVQRRAPR